MTRKIVHWCREECDNHDSSWQFVTCDNGPVTHHPPPACWQTIQSRTSNLTSELTRVFMFEAPYATLSLCPDMLDNTNLAQCYTGINISTTLTKPCSVTNAQIVLTVFVSRVTKKCWTNVDKRQSGWLHWYFSFGCIAVTEIINLAPILSWSDSRTMVELTKPWEASGHFAQFNIFYPMTRGDRKYRSQSKLWHKILHL